MINRYPAGCFIRIRAKWERVDWSAEPPCIISDPGDADLRAPPSPAYIPPAMPIGAALDRARRFLAGCMTAHPSTQIPRAWLDIVQWLARGAELSYSEACAFARHIGFHPDQEPTRGDHSRN